MSAIGLIIIFTGNVFLVFAIGRIINGIGQSLYSGTHESLMYDTLKSAGKENTYDHVVARVETLVWIGLFIAAVSGGFLYDYWKLGPFIITTIIYIVAAFSCLLLDEPKIDSETFNLKNYVKQNMRGFSELFKDARTSIISVLMITVASGYFIASKILGISQAQEYGLSGSSIGLLFGSGYIVAAIVSHLYPKLRKQFGNAKLLLVATTALLASFIFAPFVGVILGSFLITLRISSSTTFGNAKSVIMNRFISSQNRSTALSTLTLLSQIPFTVSFYFIGKYIDIYSPNSFALLLGGILVILLIPQMLVARRYSILKI